MSFFRFIFPRFYAAKRSAAIIAFCEVCETEKERHERRYDGLCEDSYATRYECRTDLAEVSTLLRTLEDALDTGGMLVDLRKSFVVYSAEDEAIEEYEARMSGLEYVAADRAAERRYNRQIERYAPHLDAMRQAGVDVMTGFNRVSAED